MLSERENIRGFWFYYLYAGRKWHVFLHKMPHMIKIAENLDTLADAKYAARTYEGGKH